MMHTARLNSPGDVIASIPTVLGFTPVASMVIVTVNDDSLDAVMRLDLTDVAPDGMPGLAGLIAGNTPDHILVVFVDAKGFDCAHCAMERVDVTNRLSSELSGHGITMSATLTVREITDGAEWHCLCGCGEKGAVPDPHSTSVAAEAVVAGRRMYGTREQIVKLVTPDPDPIPLPAAKLPTPKLDIAIPLAVKLIHKPFRTVGDLAWLGRRLAQPSFRDAVLGLAITGHATATEQVLLELSRLMPQEYRADPLALAALFAYIRGDGPLAGVALDEARKADPGHRLAGMTETALRSGMRPDQIRNLAQVGYNKIADILEAADR